MLVLITYPLKQGLKHSAVSPATSWLSSVLITYPLKQGLKRAIILGLINYRVLITYPLKQGLKQRTINSN
ncbi:hypothetical protein GMMP13_1650018 [Candidatus Magnetomoraceae bacterium gMMP-13]